MNFEKMYKNYEENVNKLTHGLVETNKAEFYKFCIFYDMMKDWKKEEMKRQLQKQKEFKMEYESIWRGESSEKNSE